MTPRALLEKAHRFGLHLAPKGDRLSVIPADKMPPELRAELLANKTALLAWMSAPPCPGWQAVPPDNLPLVPNEPRPSADTRAAVIDYVFRQLPPWNVKPAALARWINARENAYFDGPGKSWRCESFAYAAARDCACWQLNCTEADLLNTFAAFDGAATKRKT